MRSDLKKELLDLGLRPESCGVPKEFPFYGEWAREIVPFLGVKTPEAAAEECLAWGQPGLFHWIDRLTPAAKGQVIRLVVAAKNQHLIRWGHVRTIGDENRVRISLYMDANISERMRAARFVVGGTITDLVVAAIEAHVDRIEKELGALPSRNIAAVAAGRR